MTVRVAIAGLGKMGIMHAANLRANPEAEIIAVVDVQAQLARQAKGLGLDVPFYPSIEQLLDQIKVDAVFVCTPAATHLPMARPCLERGVHVFVEKPLADTLPNARRMFDLVDGSRLIHAVGYMKAHYPLYQQMRALVQGGTLGRIQQCHCTLYLSQVFRAPTGWVYNRGASGGGIVMNSTCHLLFLLQWFFGRASGVFARARSIHSSVDDVATMILEFGDGIVASVDTSWAVPGYSVEHTQILLIGERGSAEITDERARLHLTRAAGEYPEGWTGWHRSAVDHAPVDLSAEYGGEGYYNEDAEFIRCCASGGQPLVTWRDGLRVQELIDAIYRSVASGYVSL